MGDFERTLDMRVPPFQFDNLFESEVGNEVEEMMGDDQGGRASDFPPRLPRDCAQGLAVKVIEVSMRDQHHVHGRKIAQVKTGLAQTLQDKQPAGEVGINDDIHPTHLEKKAGMPDKGNA